MADRIPTLADVCHAIAEGELTVASDGNSYQVSARELRRYFNQQHPLSALAFIQALSLSTDSSGFTSPDLCSSGR